MVWTLHFGIIISVGRRSRLASVPPRNVINTEKIGTAVCAGRLGIGGEGSEKDLWSKTSPIPRSSGGLRRRPSAPARGEVPRGSWGHAHRRQTILSRFPAYHLFLKHACVVTPKEMGPVNAESHQKGISYASISYFNTYQSYATRPG